jgi:hypothetical protein
VIVDIVDDSIECKFNPIKKANSPPNRLWVRNFIFHGPDYKEVRVEFQEQMTDLLKVLEIPFLDQVFCKASEREILEGKKLDLELVKSGDETIIAGEGRMTRDIINTIYCIEFIIVMRGYQN